MRENAIITGAGGNIGLAIARLFAFEGYNLCLCVHSLSKVSALKDYADRLSSECGIKTCIITLDVSSKEECRKAVEYYAARFGRIDVLVNNAGCIDYSLFHRTRQEDYRKVLSCNLDGVFFMCQEVGKIMKKQGTGSIVNISSVAGINGCVSAAAYSASKGGVNALTVTIAREFARYGIRVNAVAPGMIDGGLSDLLDETQKENACSSIAMNRFGKPEEVADAVFFLASSKSSYITGQILRIDGGLF